MKSQRWARLPSSRTLERRARVWDLVEMYSWCFQSGCEISPGESRGQKGESSEGSRHTGLGAVRFAVVRMGNLLGWTPGGRV